MIKLLCTYYRRWWFELIALGEKYSQGALSDIVRFVTCLENSWCHGDLRWCQFQTWLNTAWLQVCTYPQKSKPWLTECIFNESFFLIVSRCKSAINSRSLLLLWFCRHIKVILNYSLFRIWLQLMFMFYISVTPRGCKSIL